MERYEKFNNQHYKRLALKCRSTGQNFHDDTFPPEEKSLWRVNRLNIQGTVEWKRVKDICKKPHLFVYENGQATPEVVQGVVGNCWLVTALSVLAAHPSLLHKVIPRWRLQDWVHADDPGFVNTGSFFNDIDRHPGIFRFRFYRFGKWVEVVVDDYLPTVNNHLIYAHARNPNEVWCALVEKAYAKLCGCYEALEAGSASDAMVDLTGTVPETIELDRDSQGKINGMTEESLMDHLKKANKEGGLMSCSINVQEGEQILEQRLSNGLIVGHAYGITKIRNLKHSDPSRNETTLLLKLHNPWGQGEWNGAWSDDSPNWNTINNSQRKKFNVKVDDDGDFWMSTEDFLANFSTLTIARHLNTTRFTLGSRWYSQSFTGAWSKRDSTADTRLKRLEGGLNLTIGFICLKVEENRKYRIHQPTYEVAGQITYSNAREVTARLRLKSGRYVLIPSTFEPGQESKYFLRMFSSHKLNTTLLSEDKPVKKWYNSILYPENSYFMGMLRVKIIEISLKREVHGGCVKTIFSDLKTGKRNQNSDSVIKHSLDTIAGQEYVFYVRDPKKSNIAMKLYEKGIVIGEVQLDIGRFAADDKQGKMFEVTKPFTKIVKVETKGESANGKAKQFMEHLVNAEVGEVRVRITYFDGFEG
ncbi:hypothetical protein G9A89_014011 [Geosiphon pyriformis]|nr:hypothetical protein G9A89_014011 [Geosiphon pyriformis]